MKTGYSEAVITPELGVVMPGYFAERVSDGVLEDLTVSATAFSEGEGAAIFISIDLCSYIEPFTGDIRKRVCERTGVPAEAVIVSANHTHTGHATNFLDFKNRPNFKVMQNTADRAVEVAAEAWETRTDALLSNGHSTEEKFVFIRNYYMKDGSIKMNPSQRRVPEIVRPMTEPYRTIEVLKITHPDGSLKEIIFNFACHPDTVGGTKYSPDWPGVVREELKKIYGQNVAVQFFNGAAGDVNHLDPFHLTHLIPAKEGKLFYREMGKAVAADAVPAVDGARPVRVDAIRALTREYESRRRYPTKEQFDWAREVVKNPENYPIHEQVYADEYLEMERHHYGDLNYCVTTVALGDVVFVTAPGELYTAIGRAIRERSPFARTIVVGLANGDLGYLSPAEIVNSTAYEGTVCLYNSVITETFAEEFIQNVTQQLNDLHRAFH